ncbi:MAG: DUF2029 domain-containing protein [candidate division Zixibacteria bacterium]|nr:DUF2029 domain-containing protein [candidate division Zixibacteria bacterium]
MAMVDFAFDFNNIWRIGLAVLQGRNPYLDLQSYYPPATTILFGAFALVPIEIAYLILASVSALILVNAVKRKAIGWLFFVPVFFMFVAGQIDLLFFALIPFLDREDWKAPVAAALFTLKPQIAAVVLPWYLWRWLRGNRIMLARLSACALALHLAPIFVRPTIYAEWIATTGYGAGHKFGGIGIWRLSGPIVWPVIAVVSVGLIILALRSDEKTSRIALTLANPVFAYYDAVMLIETAPWYILTPASILALVTSHMIGETHAPFAIVPIAALLYRLGLTITALTSRISVRSAEGERKARAC